MCQPRSDAHGLPIPVAARMGGKSEENILSEPWRQVDQFSSRQVDMSRKVAYPHRINEPLQALDADQFEIGSDFAGKMRIFVKDILGYDPNLSAAQLEAKGTIPSSAADIFLECEIISLHLPYTPASHHFISDREIGLMKRQPIVINVSRGGLIDTQALIRGLRSNQLSGAGLDVLETEPEIPQELLQFENVIVTPHAAWYSVEASEKLRRTAITDILRVLSGQKPHYPVPG